MMRSSLYFTLSLLFLLSCHQNRIETEGKQGDKDLSTAACRASDFKVDGKIDIKSRIFTGQVSLSVKNVGGTTLDHPQLGFYFYKPDTLVIRDRDGHSLTFEGPGFFKGSPCLMVVHLERILQPGDSESLSFNYQITFDGEVSNHIGPDNSWFTEGSFWYPRLGDTILATREQNAGLFEMTIRVPPGQMVASIGTQVSCVADSTGWVYTWQSPIPIRTFACAEYKVLEKTVDQLHYRIFVYPQHMEGAQSVLEAVSEYVQFYSSLFGAYPNTTFNIAEVNRRGGWGGGPLLLNTRFFVPSTPGRALPHEVAHQWWGRLGPGLISLGEGLAEYSAALAMAQIHHQPFPLEEWQVTNTKAIGNDVPLSKFDPFGNPVANQGVAYGKGPYILHMLRHTVGDANFYSSMKRFYSMCRENAAPPGLAEFEATFTKTASIDLSWFFDQWFRDNILPDYTFEGVDSHQRDGITSVKAIVMNMGTGKVPVTVELRTDGPSLSKEVRLAAGTKDTIAFETRYNPKKLVIDPDQWLLQDYSSRGVYLWGEAGSQSGDHLPGLELLSPADAMIPPNRKTVAFDLGDLGFTLNSSTEKVNFQSDGVLNAHVALDDSIRVRSEPVRFQFWKKDFLRNQIKNRLLGRPEERNWRKLHQDNEVAIVLIPFSDRMSEIRFWKRFTEAIRKPVNRYRRLADETTLYGEFATDSRAMCFWAKDRWFVYIAVGAGITEGDISRAEEMREQVRNLLVAHFKHS